MQKACAMPKRVLAIAALALALAVGLQTPAALAEDDVDVVLVLAADVSRSVDERKFKLQREGYAAALTHPRVLKAIESGPAGRVAVCFVEWSGPFAQAVMIDWTIVANAKDAQGLAAR